MSPSVYYIVAVPVTMRRRIVDFPHPSRRRETPGGHEDGNDDHDRGRGGLQTRLGTRKLMERKRTDRDGEQAGDQHDAVSGDFFADVKRHFLHYI